MEPQPQGSEERLAHLEAQIDHLSSALHQRDIQDHLPPMERRLAQLTEQCADLVKQWSATGERHAHAIGELEARLTGWNDVETRLQREALSRFQALERAIEGEWAVLKRLHEEPARQLRSHAESLAEICVATAGSAQTGLERAEARLATIERDLHRRMDDLCREVQAAVAELRHHGEGTAMRAASSPWAFDEVARLHHELRDSGPRPVLASGAWSDAPDTDQTAPTARDAGPLFGSTLDSRVGGAPAEPAEPSAAIDSAPSSSGSSHWKWYAAVAVLALGIGISATLAASFYRQADAAAVRADEAKQHAEQIATAADQRIEAARQDAAVRITQANAVASKAQVTSDVLAAPDLIRFNLAGGDAAARVSAQLLWSRSRGMVFSATRLPALPPGTTYQIWLLTATEPISAGTFIPDAAGRVTAATEEVPAVPRPVIGATVTVEPEPGRQTPSGAVVLARAQ